VRVFNRHGVDKDERALAIERAEIERLGKDRDDEFAILNRNMTSRLRELIVGKTAVSGPKGLSRGEVSSVVRVIPRRLLVGGEIVR
jgi:DNA-directed RNA polymerase subunit beta